MSPTFEWDESKAITNEQTHGISFDEASTVFEDPYSVTLLDEEHSEDEDRFIDIGESRSGRLLVVTLPNATRTSASSVAGWRRERNGEHMSNSPNDQNQDDDMAPEYDFSHGGVRGKHFKAMRNGYTIVIHKTDGTTEVREVAPRPGTVVLDPDVRPYFPDAESVNRALRGLISLLPQHASPGETR